MCLCDKQLQNESLNHSLALRWALPQVSVPLSPASWCALPHFEGNEEEIATEERNSSDFAVSRPWGVCYTCLVADRASFFLYTCGQYNGLLLKKKPKPKKPTENQKLFPYLSILLGFFFLKDDAQ